MTPPTSRIALVAPDAWPASSGRTERQHGVGRRREHERHPDAAHDEARHELHVGRVDRGHGGDPRDRDRLQREAADHQRARTDPVGQQTRDRRDDHRHRRPRQRAQAGLQRAVALGGLEHLGQEEDRPEDAEVHDQRDDAGRREAARAEEAHRQHRLRRRATRRRRTRPAARRRARASRRPWPSPSPRGCRARCRTRSRAGRCCRARDRRDPATRAGPRLSNSTRRATGISARPTGTLIQKIQCQEMPSTTAPPTSGPRATPRPLTPDQMPIAMPRFWGGNASESRVRLSGATIAAPAPWMARATISAVVVGASAARR